MKQSYLWTWPLAVLSLLIGLHMLFTMSSVFSEYKTAVHSAEIIKNDGKKITASVKINYSYENHPEMGSKYGADVIYETANGKEAAWIAMKKPTGISNTVNIMYNENIHNFAINADYPVLPHEIPNETNQKISLALVALPLFYVLFEFFLFIRSRIRNEPLIYQPLTLVDPQKATSAGIIALVFFLFQILPAVGSLLEYNAAGNRISAVREQNNIILANLSDKCPDRVGEDCDNRYKAVYRISGSGDFHRFFQVKGDIISDAKLQTFDKSFIEPVVPLLYNSDDPRFSYALSSSEQVRPPYNAFRVIGASVLMAFSIPVFIAAMQQKRRNPITDSSE